MQLLDVLCAGQAAYDLVFSVPFHPASDEKICASDFMAGGGGPAANAAVAVARLGLKAGFTGYLGRDVFGERHLEELKAEGVITDWVLRGTAPTPLSAVLVKPDGQRALVNYRAHTPPVARDAIHFDGLKTRVLLLDGHEPHLSMQLVELARARGIPTVLDAGSLHPGTELLGRQVDYLVASERYAQQETGATDPARAVAILARHGQTVVVTLSERGLIWQRGDITGRLTAYPVNAIDSTGAGDSFHGAFAAALALGMDWTPLLRFASAAGALCCTRMGARAAIPHRAEVEALARSAPPLDHQSGP